MKSPKPGSKVQVNGQWGVVESQEATDAFLARREAFMALSEEQQSAEWDKLLSKSKKGA